jgi:hypothetical protein
MDFIDLFWNLSQDNAIRDIVETQASAIGRDAVLIKRLQAENRELQIRVGLLIRLLIERSVFTAEDFTKLMDETKARLDQQKARISPRPAISPRAVKS